MTIPTGVKSNTPTTTGNGYGNSSSNSNNNMAPRMNHEGNDKVGETPHGSSSGSGDSDLENAEYGCGVRQEGGSGGVRRRKKGSDGVGDDGTESVGTSESEPLIQLFTGMHDDLKARLPYYRDDWGRPRSLFTVVNATIFAFVIQLIPALIFAELIDRQTEGNLGVAETLLSSAVIGIIYAIFSGQPIVIMGITGPVALLLGTSYGLTKQFDAEYFPFFFWICIWAGLMHVVSAMVGLVSLVWKVTPFTSQIFELFIAITFIYSSLRDLIAPLELAQPFDPAIDRSAEYASFFVGLITCAIAWSLHFAESWAFFTRQVRGFLTAYNTLIAIVIGTAFSYLPGVDQASNPNSDGIPRVSLPIVPWDWQPTADRAWLINPLQGIDARGIFAAMVPGFMFFLLFIIDHNVSSILTQAPKFNLKKPSAYHWDFFVLGLTFVPCAMLGLPPGNGLIPQAPLHARALCTRKFITDEHGVRREVVTYIEEQRWSGLGQALLMFPALALFVILAMIPNGCLFGLFLYLGMGALHGNEIWERVTLCFIVTKKRPAIPVVREVKSWRTVQFYTLIQVCCAFLIFAVAQFLPVGYIYPALLTLLVPFRSYILDRWFDEGDLKHLDPTEETEEDYHEEQRVIRMAERRTSFDEEELIFPNRAEFRAGGLKRTMRLKQRRHSFSHNPMESLMAPEKHVGADEVEIVTPIVKPIGNGPMGSWHPSAAEGSESDTHDN